jgi:saccharopine dehydrogenase-like NADP-dependent oxidoreductase
VEMLQNSVDRSKLGNKDKSSALKRLHKIAVKGESVGTPLDFLSDLIEHEWNHAENSGGKTFMGTVVKGVTRKIMDTQNGLLYGKRGK